MAESKVVVASACSCGIRCRWHGKKCSKTKAIRDAEAKGYRVIPVCPEMLGGLPCPRPPVRTIKGRVYITDPETRKEIGKDITDIFVRGAEEALQIAIDNDATAFLGMKMSPSCAVRGIAGKVFADAGIPVIPIY